MAGMRRAESAPAIHVDKGYGLTRNACTAFLWRYCI